MQSFGESVKKALYFGVGLVSLASEKAGTTLSELRQQSQKLADEIMERGEITAEEASKKAEQIIDRVQQMVERGEISAEEARKKVEQMVAQVQQVQQPKDPPDRKPSEPRKIEIVFDEDEETTPENPEKVEALRKQVSVLQEELNRLQED